MGSSCVDEFRHSPQSFFGMQGSFSQVDGAFNPHITDRGGGAGSCASSDVLCFCKDVFYMYAYLAYLGVCVLCVPLVPPEVSRGCQMLWDRSDREL